MANMTKDGSASGTAAASRLSLSALAPETLQSEIRAMTTECDRIGGINLAQGVCDTPPPPVIVEAAHQAIRDGYNIYTRCDGMGRLREAVAAKQRRDYGLDYDAEREVLVASGATAGLHSAILALLNAGDEVVVALAAPDWSLDVDELKAAISPRTRAILLNTPANPSGKIFTREEIEAVA